MPNPEHLNFLQEGMAAWDGWRKGNPGSLPDLSDADLRGADLNMANLRRANLSRAYLKRAYLGDANLEGANLSDANLNQAQLINTDFRQAKLTGSSIYGIAAWDVKLNAETQQQNLIITPSGEPVIMVDNIKVAQFIYLLLNNEEVRHVIDTITSKAVLILGRFSPERKIILDGLRDELRARHYVPILFDFEQAKSRDTVETIRILVGMAKFVMRGSAVFDGDAVGKIEGIVSVKGWAKLSAWPPVNG
jgi:hypothetical protein